MASALRVSEGETCVHCRRGRPGWWYWVMGSGAGLLWPPCEHWGGGKMGSPALLLNIQLSEPGSHPLESHSPILSS